MARSAPLLLGALLAAALSAPATAQSETGWKDGKPRVLFLTHSAGYQHEVVKRLQNVSFSLAENQLRAAAGDWFDVAVTQNCRAVEALADGQYAAVVFYTTGELPLTERGREALMQFVNGGGGFVGIHCATDTFYQWPEYGEMIGGYFDGHPWTQKVDVEVTEPTHPAVMHLGPRFTIEDEIYQHRAFDAERVRTLLRLDTGSVDASLGKRADGHYALAWCRDQGQGRVFYTALGHGPRTWADPRFLRHLVAGITWSMDAQGRNRAAPERAIRLLDGSDESLTNWRQRDGKEVQWVRQEDGSLEVKAGSGDLVTAREFTGDYHLHVEFACPSMPDAKGQDRGNSGVYVHSSYEVQVLDSYGLESRDNDCGGIYRVAAPAVNACRPPEAWQEYDILFRAPRFDANGAKVENARLSVRHNGVLIHDDQEVPGTTGGGRPESASAPFYLQDHGNPVRYRNVWLLLR